MRASLITKSLGDHHTPVGRAGLRRCQERMLGRCGAAGTLTRGWWGGQLLRSLWKAVSYKAKHTSPYDDANCSPCYLPKGAGNLCPHTILHVNVYSSLIHHCQNWKQPRCSFSRWVVKWTMVPPDVEYCLVLERSELSNREKTPRNFKYTPRQTKPVWKKKLHTVWFQIYDIRKGKAMEAERLHSGCQGLVKEGRGKANF